MPGAAATAAPPLWHRCRRGCYTQLRYLFDRRVSSFRLQRGLERLNRTSGVGRLVVNHRAVGPFPRLVRVRAPSLRRRYPASAVLRAIRHLRSPVLALTGSPLAWRCRSTPHPQTSLVAHCSCPVRAATTTPVGSPAACLARFAGDGGLPRYCGGSAPTLDVSRPARCSLALRPARPAEVAGQIRTGR